MVKRFADFRGSVGGVGVDEMALVGSGSLAVVVGKDGCWRTAGRGGVFPTAELSDGAVATVTADALPIYSVSC